MLPDFAATRSRASLVIRHQVDQLPDGRSNEKLAYLLLSAECVSAQVRSAVASVVAECSAPLGAKRRERLDGVPASAGESVQGWIPSSTDQTGSMISAEAELSGQAPAEGSLRQVDRQLVTEDKSQGLADGLCQQFRWQSSSAAFVGFTAAELVLVNKKTFGGVYRGTFYLPKRLPSVLNSPPETTHRLPPQPTLGWARWPVDWLWPVESRSCATPRLRVGQSFTDARPRPEVGTGTAAVVALIMSAPSTG